MIKGPDKTINTELLVVGGSGAAVTAAVYASREGVDVLLVSKGRAGFSGNAMMAGGGFGIDGESGKEILNVDYADPSFTKEMLYDCIIKESYYLADQKIVRRFVEDVPTVLKDYLKWAKNSGAKLLPILPCGWQSSGAQFERAVGQGLKENPQVDIIQDTMVVDLLKSEGVITGAIAVDIYSGEIIQINAKCVVLGTGGYQLSTLKNTVSDMTGDGQAMAYRAGAVLSDMEFSLAFPTALVPEDMRGSIYPFLFRMIPHRIVDKFGNEISIPPEIQALSTTSKLNKLTNCYYMGNIAEKGLAGPHGGAFWDYSETSEEDKKKGFESFYKRYSTWYKYGYYKGESMKRVEDMVMNNTPIEVGLGVEYSMGGIVVNENMETCVPGLLAAGEVATGTFGALRVADGLAEMLGQGMRAGLTAAEFCRSNSRKESNPDMVQAVVNKLENIFENKDGPNAISFYSEVERTCDIGLGVIRNEKGLAETNRLIKECKQLASNLTLDCKSKAYNFEWIRAIEAQNLLVCAEAAARAALERRESRGCHMRSDYEEVNHDDYLVHYRFKDDGKGEMLMYSEKPEVIDREMPTGKRANVLQYFADQNLEYKRVFKVSELKEEKK